MHLSFACIKQLDIRLPLVFDEVLVANGELLKKTLLNGRMLSHF